MHIQQVKPTAAPVCLQTPGDLVRFLNKFTKRCSIQKNSRKYRKEKETYRKWGAHQKYK